jgi:hypothetical protein
MKARIEIVNVLRVTRPYPALDEANQDSNTQRSDNYIN